MKKKIVLLIGLSLFAKVNAQINADLLNGKNGAFYGESNTLTQGNNVDYNAVSYNRNSNIIIQPIHLPNFTGQINAPFQDYGLLTTIGGLSMFPTQLAFSQSGKIAYRTSYKSTDTYTFSNAWRNIVTIGSGITANYIPKFGPEGTLYHSAIYDNGGNIGIGTTAPVDKLHLINSGDTYANLMSGVGYESGIKMTQGTGYGFNVYSDDTGTGGNKGFNIDRISGGVATNAFFIGTSGNVGIGTVSPGSYKLNVNGTTYFNGASTINGTSTVNGSLNVNNSSSGYSNYSGVTFSDVDWQGSRIGLNRYRGTSAAPAILQNNDNVGWFDCWGYDGSALQRVGQLSIVVDGTPTTGKVPGKFSIATVNSTGTNTARFTAYANDNIVMATNGGNVGIGTTTPQAKLHVNNGDNSDASVLATTTPIGGVPTQYSKLLVSSLSEGAAANTPTFKLGHQFWGNNNNGYITFYRGGGQAGGFLQFGTNGLDRMRIDGNGNVGIGTTAPVGKLDVNGTIRAKEVLVTETGWADFVFDKDYKLRDLKEVDQYIQENGHLPEIPSKAEVKENGVNIVEVQAKLLQKVEEMTLYIIQQQKEINELKQELKKSKR